MGHHTRVYLLPLLPALMRFYFLSFHNCQRAFLLVFRDSESIAVILVCQCGGKLRIFLRPHLDPTSQILRKLMQSYLRDMWSYINSSLYFSIVINAIFILINFFWCSFHMNTFSMVLKFYHQGIHIFNGVFWWIIQ